MLAWLPCETREEAERRFGPLPSNVEVDFYPDADVVPDSIDRVQFLVLPYGGHLKALDRVGEMSALQVVLTQNAGFNDVLDLIPDGVQLVNAVGVHDTSTAEMALTLALAVGRNLDRYVRAQDEGRWDRYWGDSLADRRVLILGYGGIGKAIEARVVPFEPAGITRVARTARDGIHGFTELDALLPEADVVFLAAPLTEETEGILDARRLALLPDGALVVNVGRGPLVVTEALLAECRTGRLRAGLDVTDPEPLPADHELWRLPGVVISPHVGGTSSAFRPRSDRLIGSQLRAWAGGEELRYRVK
ncbi:2-hydroxyacid dehydrogenase [Granulicoccus phenolivorans]|uniref:2-hydroxyacid dehydrogenase n=1 Tax=Granulicoccus phenolivorans TaxID=266854 RepID=UPI0004181414|nr:2-hydroxyacid dehydrogenase [Granulicoccus phenolivorans]